MYYKRIFTALLLVVVVIVVMVVDWWWYILVCQTEKQSARRKVNTRKLFHLLQKLLSVKLDNDYCAQEGRKVHNEKESAMTQQWSKSYFSKEIFLFSA